MAYAERGSQRHRIVEPLRGIVTMSVMGLITLLVFVPFLPLAVIKLLMPTAALQQRVTPALLLIARLWVITVSALFRTVAGVHIDCRGETLRDPRGRYLLIGNHRTWADILVLVRCFDGHIPFPRFFIKYELLWFPVVGVACWAMDFPFMRRYRKQALAKRPELKGRDLETTRKACEKYRQQPVTVVNFAEGTRFTPAKHANTRSPYRHLLRPKSAGAAFMVQSMADVLTGILDVTIVYADCDQPTLWDYGCGRVRHVIVSTRRVAVPTTLLRAPYADEPDVRHGFQNWMNDIWRRKDAEIDRLRQDGPSCEGRLGTRRVSS